MGKSITEEAVNHLLQKMLSQGLVENKSDSQPSKEENEVGEILINKGEINWLKSAVNGTAYTIFFLVIFKLFAMVEILQKTIDENNKANVKIIENTIKAQSDLKHSIDLLVNTVRR